MEAQPRYSDGKHPETSSYFEFELLILLYLPSSPGFVAHVPLPLLQLHCLQLLAFDRLQGRLSF